MKWLLSLMEHMRTAFEEGGKLRPLKPVFEATENFFFAPERRTDRSPHIRDPLDLKRYMSTVIIALAPATLAALYFFGLRLLPMIAVSYAAGGAVEVLFAVVRKEEISEGFLVTGLLFPLILPPTLPLWMVALGVAFGVLVGKELFGGTGRNLFNPALVGRLFLFLAYPSSMAAGWVKPVMGGTGRLLQYVSASSADAISSATPLIAAKGGQHPWDLWQMFIGNVPGSAGETSALAILIGGVYLLFTRVANWRTVVSTLGSFALLGFILHQAQPAQFGPVLWQLLAGGLLFGAFFMATDPVSSPVTNPAKWAYGTLIGACALLIRGLTGYVEGVMFAILLGNIAAPIMDEVVVRGRLRRLAHEK
jgi:Na(+)-translocating NADH:ubiquinone oxidoreductase B subunit